MRRVFLFAGVCGLAVTAAASCWADPSKSTAPAMMDVKEIILQYSRIGNMRGAEACGIMREDIAQEMYKMLKIEGISAIPVTQAKVVNPKVARMELVPEIVTVATAAGDCTSWVALTAQGASVAVVPPVDMPRSILVTYWRSGQMVASTQSSHHRIARETLLRLTQAFAKQYLLDQPPPLPDLSGEDKGTASPFDRDGNLK